MSIPQPATHPDASQIRAASRVAPRASGVNRASAGRPEPLEVAVPRRLFAWVYDGTQTSELGLGHLNSKHVILDAVTAKISHLDPSSQHKVRAEIERFLVFLKTEQAHDLAEVTDDHVGTYLLLPTQRFGVWRDPSPSTARNRRWALGFLGQAASLLDIPAIPLMAHHPAPPRSPSHPRALTDREMHLCRLASAQSLFDTRRPSLVALAEASAWPSEMATLRPDDLDLVGGTITIRRTRDAAPRTNTLTPWGAKALCRRLDHVDVQRSSLLVMSRADVSKHAATASISGDLTRILRRAGIASVDVGPSSIRAWGASAVFRGSGSIIEVARWLGTPSLDTAATTIGWDWARS